MDAKQAKRGVLNLHRQPTDIVPLLTPNRREWIELAANQIKLQCCLLLLNPQCTIDKTIDKEKYDTRSGGIPALQQA